MVTPAPPKSIFDAERALSLLDNEPDGPIDASVVTKSLRAERESLALRGTVRVSQIIDESFDQLISLMHNADSEMIRARCAMFLADKATTAVAATDYEAGNKSVIKEMNVIILAAQQQYTDIIAQIMTNNPAEKNVVARPVMTSVIDVEAEQIKNAAKGGVTE